MKNRKPTLSILVAAALMGLGQVAAADEQTPEVFIPLERLSPKERSNFIPQLQELSRRSNIDWEKYILGVNEKGELILRERSTVPSSPVAQPSCWSEGT